MNFATFSKDLEVIRALFYAFLASFMITIFFVHFTLFD